MSKIKLTGVVVEETKYLVEREFDLDENSELLKDFLSHNDIDYEDFKECPEAYSHQLLYGLVYEEGCEDSDARESSYEIFLDEIKEEILDEEQEEKLINIPRFKAKPVKTPRVKAFLKEFPNIGILNDYGFEFQYSWGQVDSAVKETNIETPSGERLELFINFDKEEGYFPYKQILFQYDEHDELYDIQQATYDLFEAGLIYYTTE